MRLYFEDTLLKGPELRNDIVETYNTKIYACVQYMYVCIWIEFFGLII